MSKTPIQLSDHFTCGRLIRFTLPSITMIIFTAIYGVVDGFFVSNYAGKTPFAAVNLIIPVLLILGSVGFMFGTGGGALIAKTMGQGDRQRANNIFSMIVYASAACGVVLAALGFVILRPAAVLMGAEGELLEQALIYGRINLIALPFYVLQYEFQCLFATAEKPRLGLFVTVAAGVANMVLDALFVGVFSWGAAGAAASTVAVCLPSFAVIYLISLFFDQFLRLSVVASAFHGIQVCVIYLILSAGLKMLKELEHSVFNLVILTTVAAAMVGCSIAAVSFSSIFYILFSGAAGLLVYAVQQLRKGEKKP